MKKRNREKYRPKDLPSLRADLTRLGKIIDIDKKYFVQLFFLTLFTSGTVVLIPYITARIIDLVSAQGSPRQLSKFSYLILGLVFIYIVDMIFKIYNDKVLVKISQKAIFKIRETTFNKLQKLPISYFYQTRKGEIISRMLADIEDISLSISETLVQVLSSVITLVGISLIMVKLSPPLAILNMVTIPISSLIIRLIAKKTRRLELERQILAAQLNGLMKENIDGLASIKAFNLQEASLRNFKEKNDQLRRIATRSQIYSGLMMPMMNVLRNLNFILIATLGGLLASNNIITIGVITAFISYSRQFSKPINELAESFNTLQSGLAGSVRIVEILDLQEEDLNPTSDIMGDRVQGKIEFRNVSFSYQEGRQVLKNISFIVEPGENIALVGPTGAGKTSIINLLTGLFTNYSGQILIDNIDIRLYNQRSLRNIFGVVLQATYLFSGTIGDNISYGKKDASQEEILKASYESRAQDFIRLLPQGLDTRLLAGGTNLSPGERQLIAISRALIKDPRILVLDEATSSIDTGTEMLIQESMVDIMQGRTSIMIAHRLSTIRKADRIILINQGRLVEIGPHQELMEARQLYYRLYKSQTMDIT